MRLKLKLLKLNVILVFLLALALMSGQAIGQQRTVEGVVVDKTGSPLPGVTVVIKGTTLGTISDTDGKFTLPNVTTGTTLVFSFVGMSSQEVRFENQSSLRVAMIDETIGIDEVVAIGYGTQSKRFVTGSVASADMSLIRDFPSTNVTQTLSNVPGILFTGTGRPGQDGALLIRGQNSLSASNNPLIVVDGIIFVGELSDLNPNDIQAVDVLKDASASSVYGSRAANGVILITTKRGKSEKPTVNFDAHYGISDVANSINLLSPERYIERRLDLRRLNGLEADPSKVHEYLNPDEAANYQSGKSTNQWDLVTRIGKISTYNASISGDTKGANYYLSASYSDDQGLVIGDQEKRTTVRANISANVTDWLNLGITSSFSHRDRSGASASLNNMYRVSPWGTFFREDGSIRRNPVSDELAAQNPLYENYLLDKTVYYDNLYSNLFAQVDIPGVQGLTYRFNYSPNIRWNQDFQFMEQDPYWTGDITSARKFNSKRNNWVTENILTYRRMFGDDHGIDVTLLYGRHHTEYESTTANASRFDIDILGYNNLALAGLYTNQSDAWKSDGVSSMARVNYQYKKRYMFSLTARRDGSSVFAADNKYALFPSASFGWMISDEEFLKDSKLIDMMKLRVSYGSVGNEAISPYQSLSMSGLRRYVFGDGGSSSIGIYNSQLGNNKLKWETVNSTNIALDFSILNQRIDGSVEVYNTATKDLLVRQAIPIMNGYSSILTNIGETNNKGIEFTINTLNFQSNLFSWRSNIGYAHNQNKIVKLYGTDLNGDGKEDDDPANGWFIGHPINSYYDYKVIGIYQVGDSDIPQGQSPGFVRVEDIDGVNGITPNDRTIVGNGDSPKHQVSFRNTFKYDNISLSVFMNGMFGWVARFNLIDPLVPERAFGGYDAGWWTPENKSNTRPSLLYSNPLDHGWYRSRDFVRIRDIALSYDLKEQMLDKINLSGLRFSLSVKNLYTFTDWPGTDPENASDYSEQGGNQLYPMPRTFSVGMNITF